MSMAMPVSAVSPIGPAATIGTVYGSPEVPGVMETVAALQRAALALMTNQPVITPEFPVGPGTPPYPREPDPIPSDAAITFDGQPNIDVTYPLDLATMPTFTAIPPDFMFGVNVPNIPNLSIPGMPGIDMGDVPDAPTVDLPAAPSLMSVAAVPFAGISLPTFSAAEPVLAVAEPTITPYVPGSQYTSALLTTLQETLNDRIANGGTGLAADVEQAIWDRAREREIKVLEDAILDLERMEAMGFEAPPGVYFDARLKVRTEYGKVETGLSRDIAIKQAELELANVQEALKIATQLEGQFMDYVSKIEQRVFESVKFTTEAGVQIYNAKVQAFGVRMEAYKAQVQVYEARIRGELAKVEVYKAQIEAEKLKVDANTAMVQQYSAMVQASMYVIEIYKAQVQAAQVHAQIESLKVQAYGEEIKAYVAKGNIYTAQVEGYKAVVQSEAVKQEGYRTQVEIFKARVEAFSKQAEINIKNVEQQIAVGKLSLEEYQTYIDAQVKGHQVTAARLSSYADVYKAQAAAIASNNDVEVKRWQAVIDQNQRVAEIAVSAAKANADLTISSRGFIIEACKTAAQVAAQLGAAAISAVSFSNSMATSNSTSTSAANVANQSDSFSQSIAEINSTSV